MDLISRAEAIRWVKTECNPYGKPTLEFESGKRVIKHLEQMPSAEPNTKWIPCSERLPYAEYGEGDSVLCCTESGLMYILYWNGGNWCVPTGEPHIWVNHKTGWHDRVIAWMPLPEPYREEREEYELATEQMEHDAMYEPTYNSEDGSM